MAALGRRSGCERGRCRPEVQAADGPRAVARLLARQLERDHPFASSTERLVDLIAGGGGSCAALSGLYGALAERLGLEAQFPFAPAHVWIRIDGVDIETTQHWTHPKGFALPDSVYYGARSRASYERPMNPREFAAEHLLTSVEALAADDPERALRLGRLGLDSIADVPELRFCYGRLLHAAGRFAEARKELERAASQLVDHPGPRIMAARTWYDERCDLQAARVAMLQAPESLIGWMTLCEIELDAACFAEAVAAVESALSMEPGSDPCAFRLLAYADSIESYLLKSLATVYFGWSESIGAGLA